MSATGEAIKRRISKTGDTVDIAPEGTRNLYHEQTPGTATTHDARIEDARIEELTDSGELVTHEGSRVFIPGDPNPGLQDEITMPDGSKPRIVNVNRQRDHKGGVVLTVLEVV